MEERLLPPAAIVIVNRMQQPPIVLPRLLLLARAPAHIVRLALAGDALPVERLLVLRLHVSDRSQVVLAPGGRLVRVALAELLRPVVAVALAVDAQPARALRPLPVLAVDVQLCAAGRRVRRPLRPDVAVCRGCV